MALITHAGVGTQTRRATITGFLGRSERPVGFLKLRTGLRLHPGFFKPVTSDLLMKSNLNISTEEGQQRHKVSDTFSFFTLLLLLAKKPEIIAIQFI